MVAAAQYQLLSHFLHAKCIAAYCSQLPSPSRFVTTFSRLSPTTRLQHRTLLRIALELVIRLVVSRIHLILDAILEGQLSALDLLAGG